MFNLKPEEMQEGKTYAFVYDNMDRGSQLIPSVSKLTTKTTVSYVFEDLWCPSQEEPWYQKNWNVPIRMINKLKLISEIPVEDTTNG